MAEAERIRKGSLAQFFELESEGATLNIMQPHSLLPVAHAAVEVVGLRWSRPPRISTCAKKQS